MFGDYGHGSLIFLTAALMILMNDRLKGTALRNALEVRYILLLMGLCACITGLMYNEFFAIPNEWFSSCYDLTTRTCTSENEEDCNPVYYPKGCSDPSRGCELDCVYPFGLDPAWYLSPDLLVFTNTLKMKLAVIIGVVHMTIGVMCKGLNSIFFGKWLDFFCEVVTGLIILFGLFGWMDVLIVSKWLYEMNPYSQDPVMQNKISYAPSIITVMINNFLAGGYPGTNDAGVQQYFFESQRTISLKLVNLVVICCVILLLVKPIVLIWIAPHSADKDEKDGFVRAENFEDDGKVALEHFECYVTKDHQSEHGGAEIAIHQFIETTEFVLGCVSNTASYLRLWALSLAHSQLSTVMLENGLSLAWKQKTSIFSIILPSWLLWYPFMTGTFGILLMMSALECFLHTLRLHWVEFQNKFYGGSGYLYEPFSF